MFTFVFEFGLKMDRYVCVWFVEFEDKIGIALGPNSAPLFTQKNYNPFNIEQKNNEKR